MPLTPNVVDVPLLPLNQHSPITDGPVGRLSRLINTQLRQYQRQGDGNGTHLQLSKRDGFDSLGTTVVNSSGTAIGSLPSSGEQFFFDSPDGLLLAANNRLYRYTGENWELNAGGDWGNNIVMPQVFRERDLYSADSVCEAVDSAAIGDVIATTWFEVSKLTDSTDDSTPSVTALNGCRMTLKNATTGAVIRAPFTVSNGAEVYSCIRVKSDGTNFWVIQGVNGGGLFTQKFRATVFSPQGELLDSQLTAALPSEASSFWDVTFMNGVIVIATPNNGTGVKFYSMSWTLLGGFVNATVTDVTIPCNGLRCDWLTNDVNQTEGFLATLDITVVVTDDIGKIYVSRIDATLLSVHQYPVVASFLVGPIVLSNRNLLKVHQIVGYRHTGSSPSLTVAISVMHLLSDSADEKAEYGPGGDSAENTEASDSFPDQTKSFTATYTVAYTSTSTLIRFRNACFLGSRAFAIGSDYVSMAYYPARFWGPLPDIRGETTSTGFARAPHFPARIGNANATQPTWFLIPLDSKQPMCGRWDYGLAGSSYLAAAYPILLVRANQTASVVSVDGATYLPGTFRALSVPQLDRSFLTIGGITFDVEATVGVRQFQIGPEIGVPFKVNRTTYIPGLLAAQLDRGIYSEQGLFGFECPQVLADTTDADIYAFGTYVYANVLERTTANGNSVKSVPSPRFSFTEPSSASLDHFVVGTPINWTLSQFARNSIYRTTFTQVDDDGENGVPSVILYKITDDAFPFYNNASGSIIDYQFTDKMEFDTQGTGEQLYTSLGELPHVPMQPFRGGCVWRNRVWWIGPDNAIWFSAEITEGVDPWTNPGYRVPINDEATSICPMDETLIIGCAHSIKRLDAVTMPNAAGLGGTVPVAFDLPFESGCTGFSAPIRLGVVYSSTTGGAWLVTRQLTNAWIGEDASTDLSVGVNGIVVDSDNRLLINANGETISVYDTVADAWQKWIPFTDSVLVATYQGKPCYISGGKAWVMNPAIRFDRDNDSDTNHHVEQLVNISPMHVGNVRGWKKTYAIQVQGTKVSDCYLNAALYYDDMQPDGIVTFYQLPETGTGTFKAEINPLIDDSTSVDLTVWDSIVSGISSTEYTPGAGFTIDIVSLEVGIHKGLDKVKAGDRARKV